MPALLRLNDSRAKSVTLVGSSMPILKLPGGYPMQFANTADLQNYLTRSAQPVVPTADVSATFQSVLGRAATPSDIAAAEGTFNAGKSLDDYRAGLAGSAEATGTLRGISLQVLGRDASPAELDGYRAQLAAGTSINDLRAGLARGGQAAADVRGLSQSVLGRAAADAEVARMQVRLTTGGTLADVRGDLAGSQEAGNAVIKVFGAELGRAPDAGNVTDMQRALAAPGGSLDGVRAYLAGTTEARATVTVAFQGELGRAPDAGNVADMQHSLAAGGTLADVRGYLAGTTEAGTDLIALYQYGLGRAPTAAELTAAQATLAQDGSLRDTYGSLGGIAGAGLVGNADQFSAVLRQAQQLGGGATSAGQRALQGVLSWAARNGPQLGAGGVAGAILLTPLNSQQVTTEVGVADHPELGARYQRAPGSISGTVTLYMRGPDGQPSGDGLALSMDAQGRLTGPTGTPTAGLLFGTLPVGAADGGVLLAPGLDATLAAPQTAPGSGIEVRNREEADLVASMQAEGKSTQAIEAALDNLRNTGGMLTADPARLVEGPGRLSNPEEVEGIRQAVQALGVAIEYRQGSLGYSPGLSPSKPGTLIMDPDASYSAWLHEYQHVIDDQAAGWSGYRIFEDSEAVWQREQSAYGREIALMQNQGREDVVKQLQSNLEAERKRIFGPSDGVRQ